MVVAQRSKGTDASQFTDSELYDLVCRGGDQRDRSFAVIYERHSAKVYAYCLRILENEDSAREVFQETFVRFYHTAMRERSVTNVHGYLIKIARNLCLDARKEFSRTANIEDFEFAFEDTTLENKEIAVLLDMALGLLAEPYREAFVLQVHNGLSYKEIADVTDVPLTTVRNRVVRAKKKMREILAPYLTTWLV